MTNFSPTSRYYTTETAEIQIGGKTLRFLRRRFVPHPENFVLLQEHTVTQGERLDHIAAHYLGDPEAFWRIADANRAMRPEALTERVGRKLRITLPEGLAGVSLA
jgi:hypothetical protein